MNAGRIAFLCAMMTGMACGAQPAGTYPISARQVVFALAANGIKVTAAEVSMVAGVVASRPNPELEVISLLSQPDIAAAATKERAWIKFGCRIPGTCLPFYVVVAMNPKENINISTQIPRAEAPRKAAPESGAIVMRAGAKATLMLAGHESQIEVAVISLERGAMGRTIRVATPDYKQFYRAEVVGADRLKGSF